MRLYLKVWSVSEDLYTLLTQDLSLTWEGSWNVPGHYVPSQDHGKPKPNEAGWRDSATYAARSPAMSEWDEASPRGCV